MHEINKLINWVTCTYFYIKNMGCYIKKYGCLYICKNTVDYIVFLLMQRIIAK